jgi:hypothetical protein
LPPTTTYACLLAASGRNLSGAGFTTFFFLPLRPGFGLGSERAFGRVCVRNR